MRGAGRGGVLPQVDPSNVLLLGQHACCAAAEVALLPGEDAAFLGPSLPAVAATLAASGAPALDVLRPP